MSRRDRISPVWAICAYFNPSRFQRRRMCYREFRRRLAAPLVTVEVSGDGSFELEAGDAEILVQLRARSVMWQKERLLNVAWEQVPRSCTKIAWLDGDVFFESDDWIEAADALLDEYPLAMLFSRVGELRRETALNGAVSLEECEIGYSLPWRWKTGDVPEGVLHSNMRLMRTNTGLAWAARREAFEELGFYDACIVGSGNRAMICAALGRYDDAIAYLRMNDRWAGHYRDWAVRHNERVRARIGCLDATLFHLWHGDLVNRRYAERHEELSRHGFDPTRDIALAPSGCWEWSSPKPEMHAFVRRYFDERREDG